MNKRRLSGILLVLGFLILALGGIIFTPPGLYQDAGIEARLRIVEDYRSHFLIAQIASVLGLTVVSVGYLLLTLHLRGDKTETSAILGAGALILGTISLAVYNLQSLSDPRTYLESTSWGSDSQSIFTGGFTWFTIAGYLLYGTIFLRGGFPRWLGFFTLGFTLLILVALLFIEPAAVELLLLLPLVVGITLLFRLKKGLEPRATT